MPARALLFILCVALSAACDGDDSCDGGGSIRCEEKSGPYELRYCQADGTLSRCVEAILCNPLTQAGCPDGFACFAAGDKEICERPEWFPCPPGVIRSDDGDGEECQELCAHDGRDEWIENAPECDEGEVCFSY